MKKIKYFIVMILLVLNGCFGSSSDSSSAVALDEAGESVININDESSLKEIKCGAEGKNQQYRLKNDIQLTDLWVPKCNADKPFLGSFDGGGHKISSLQIEADDNVHAALFSVVGLKDDDSVKAEFKNLTIEVNSITVRKYGDDGGSFGALIGKGYHVIIDNVHVRRINLDDASKDDIYTKLQIAGGLAGELYNSSIMNSSSSVNVRAEFSNPFDTAIKQGYYAGGLVGYFYGDGEISKSYAEGVVKGVYHSGGLVGQVGKEFKSDDTSTNSIKIIDSYATGDTIVLRMSGTGGTAGGLVGAITKSAEIKGCYAKGKVGSMNFEAGYDDVGLDVGGLVGIIVANSNVIIRNSYAAGEHARGGTRTGGFIGAMVGEVAVIENSYTAVSKVGGTRAVGGFIGEIGNGTFKISNCYTTSSVKGFGTQFSPIHNTGGGFIGKLGKASSTNIKYSAVLGAEINGGNSVSKGFGFIDKKANLSDELQTFYSLKEMDVINVSNGANEGVSVSKSELNEEFYKNVMIFDEGIWEIDGNENYILPTLKDVSGQDLLVTPIHLSK